MQLNSLYMRHFRNYLECRIDFSPNFNCIHGNNAQGKTNLLEAIYLLITGRSFRTKHLQELIHHNKSDFSLEASFQKHGINQKLSYWSNGKDRRILLNNNPVPSISSLLGIVQGVVATPDDQNIIKGPPHTRRYFLDMQIAQVDPLYVHHLSRYNKALKQRNLLLKQQNTHTIHVWENELAQSATYIAKQRLRTTEALEAASDEIHKKLTHNGPGLSLIYRTPNPTKEHYLELYQKHRPRELHLGATLIGPHKDDLTILIGQQEAKSFASEGQQHSCTTALRLAEWMRLASRCDELPLILIDDLGTGLDAQRQQALHEFLVDLGQTFVTSQVPHSLGGKGESALIAVASGRVLACA